MDTLSLLNLETSEIKEGVIKLIKRIFVIVVCLTMVMYTNARHFSEVQAVDERSCNIYGNWDDLKETAFALSVPVIETSAVPRIAGEYLHGATVTYKGVTTELTRDSAVTRGCVVTTGSETGVTFHIGGSRTVILGENSQIHFSELKWRDGDLLVQIQHLGGAMINDIAGKLTNNAMHETVLVDKNGHIIEIGVLGASYLTEINPDSGAVIFFFEGAGAAYCNERRSCIVAGQGAGLTDGELDIRKYNPGEINELPGVAQTFMARNGLDAEKLTEIDEDDPELTESRKLLDSYVFAGYKGPPDKWFADEPEANTDISENNPVETIRPNQPIKAEMNIYEVGSIEAETETPKPFVIREEPILPIKENSPDDIGNDDEDDDGHRKKNVDNGIYPDGADGGSEAYHADGESNIDAISILADNTPAPDSGRKPDGSDTGKPVQTREPTIPAPLSQTGAVTPTPSSAARTAGGSAPESTPAASRRPAGANTPAPTQIPEPSEPAPAPESPAPVSLAGAGTPTQIPEPSEPSPTQTPEPAAPTLTPTLTPTQTPEASAPAPIQNPDPSTPPSTGDDTPSPTQTPEPPTPLPEPPLETPPIPEPPAPETPTPLLEPPTQSPEQDQQTEG